MSLVGAVEAREAKLKADVELVKRNTEKVCSALLWWKNVGLHLFLPLLDLKTSFPVFNFFFSFLDSGGLGRILCS